MKQKYYIIAIIIVILSICLFQSCDKDCPICPKDDTGEPGNYRLYTINGHNNFTLYAIDIPADTIVDSVALNHGFYNCFLTPDGNRLLVTNVDTRQMEVYNTADLSHLETLADQYGEYYFDKTDNIGIYYSLLNEKLFFIDPVTLTPLDSINRSISDGYLDTVTNLFVAPSLEVRNIIYLIDCDTRTIDSVDAGHFVYYLAYNWLTDEIYFHGTQGDYGGFYCYDVTSDSITLTITTTAPFGGVSISPDGTKVYMTDGGDGWHFIYPRGDIWVLNAEIHELIELIPPYIIPPGDRISYPLFGRIFITPDGRRAYVGESWNNNAYTPLAVVDLQEGKIIRGLFNNEEFSSGAIAIGPVPD